jgi:hypothetical protein
MAENREDLCSEPKCYLNRLYTKKILRFVLWRISKQTCQLVSEAHKQTSLQSSVDKNISGLLEISKHVHPDAALQLERLESLNKKILECCPPEEPKPVCTYEPLIARQ